MGTDDKILQNAGKEVEGIFREVDNPAFAELLGLGPNPWVFFLKCDDGQTRAFYLRNNDAELFKHFKSDKDTTYIKGRLTIYSIVCRFKENGIISNLEVFLSAIENTSIPPTLTSSHGY